MLRLVSQNVPHERLSGQARLRMWVKSNWKNTSRSLCCFTNSFSAQRNLIRSPLLKLPAEIRNQIY
jgi:hypothetical protein